VLGAVVLGALVLGAAGCGRNVALLDFPAPAPTAPPAATTTTVTIDPSGVTEPTVAGAPPSPAVALRPGSTTLSGTVTGPDGGVAGATVEIDRIVGSATATTEAVSTTGGGWSASGLLGGRYRLRAWKAPSLAMTTTDVFYVDDGGTHQSVLALTAYKGPTVASAFAPDPPVSGEPTTVVVQLTEPSVTTAGLVVQAPLAGFRVRLDAGGEWSFPGSGEARTDGTGDATFVATCGAVGQDPLSAVVERTVAVTLSTPPCLAPPAPPTTTAPATTTVPTTTGSTAPRRHRRPGGATTTTTAPSTPP
jgi:hypothetical protein